MRFGLNKQTIENLHEVLGLYPQIKEVKIFGSRAKGNFQEGSDIDLCITNGVLNERELNELKTKIDDLMIPYRVDIVMYEKLENRDLKEHIDRVGEVFYNRIKNH